MYEVRTELRPTRHWLVCRGCDQRWRLEPEQPILPQTRDIFDGHRCEGVTSESTAG